MQLTFAPMEGVTGHIFRSVHAELFGGADRYYSPFIAPDSAGAFKVGNLRDVLPENNRGITLVPQILANRSEAFLSVARRLAELGYEEVNLNVGCPSGTVVAKHKGAGMLADLRSLDDFLADVFSLSPVRVSVKTRMGLNSTAEFEEILEIYNKYPICELIIHARDRVGMYKSSPDLAAFADAYSKSRAPVAYNGDIFTPADLERVCAAAAGVSSFMLGRGPSANPALFRLLRGGGALEKAELREFHDVLFSRTLASGLSENYTVSRMKELWFYMGCLFPEGKRALREINKSRSMYDYLSAVGTLFSSGGFDASAGFRSPT